MKVIHTVKALQQARSSITGSVGFVPTMGNLHSGHLSLIKQASLNNEHVIVSIFVNPGQFNDKEDFKNYPRTLEDDLKLLENLNVTLCFIPNEQEIYADNYHYRVYENQLSLIREGKYRPGHFEGVLTIVLKLLMLTQATNLYLGEKDYQQYQLIKGMVSAFFIPCSVHLGKTVREDSMLALSSRNRRLNPSQKQKADRFAELFHQKNKSCGEIIVLIEKEGISIDYLVEEQGRRYAAVLIDELRLIDNYSL